jgi:chromate transport protein ChrA
MDVEGQASPSRNRYRSKVDAWLAAMLIGAFLLTLLLTLAEVFSTAWWVVLLVLAIWGVVLSLLFPLYYEITPLACWCAVDGYSARFL